MKNKVLVFDLDDTLYKEVTFLRSAFLGIEQEFKISYPLISATDMYMDYLQGEDVFHKLLVKHCMIVEKSKLLELYRNHIPNLFISEDYKETFLYLINNGYILGLITDGYSITQRNKILALGIDTFIRDENIIISEEFGSEKPSFRNYEYFQNRYANCSFIYVGDNPQKDFVTPNQLGWTTICLLDDGNNIHKQDFNLPSINLPQYKIFKLVEIKNII